MRKKVLGLVMAALAISSIGAFAQSESQQTREEVKKECCKEKKEKKECKEGKKDRKDGNKDRKNKKMRDGKKEARIKPFDGIQLTEAQQAQISQLKKNRKENFKKVKAAQKQDFVKEREAFDQEVAKVLTPEQYKVYETNRDNIRAQKRSSMKKKVERMAN